MMYRTQKLRTHHPPKWPAALYLCVAVCAWNYASLLPLALVPVAAVFLAFGFISLWHWALDWFVIYHKALERPYIPSDEVRILEALANMSDNQLSAAFAAMGYEYTPPPELEPVVVDPEIAPGVTKSYAISKTDKAARNGGYLEPIRATSEGTPDRRRMQLLVEWLAGQGLIEPAAGNKPARLKDYSETRERISG